MSGKFSADLSRFKSKTANALDATRRAVAIKLFSAVINDTPVLTGRLRGNWQTSINSPVVATLDNIDLNGASTINAAEATIARSKMSDVLYLRNNLPYAYRIEYEGWSHTKAPQGMMRRNVVRFRRLLAEQARKNKV